MLNDQFSSPSSFSKGSFLTNSGIRKMNDFRVRQTLNLNPALPCSSCVTTNRKNYYELITQNRYS